MTVYDWEEMSTRERDALVAEEIMEWEYQDPQFGNPLLLKGWLVPGRKHPLIRAPRFTTNIAQSWRVVRRMKADGYHLTLKEFPEDFVEGQYAQHFVKFSRYVETAPNEATGDYKRGIWFYGPDTAPYSVADTMEQAICLAALRAKGVDV